MRGFNFPELYAVGLGQQLGGGWTGYAEWRRLKWDHVINTLDFLTAELEPVQLNLNWKDQDVYVLGTEYRPGGESGAVWRAGVNYGRSAPRPRGVNPIFPNIQEWHLTAGYEDQLTPRWRIAAAAVYAPENSIATLPENRYNLLFGEGQPYSVSNEGVQLGLSFIYAFGRCDSLTDETAGADEDSCGCDCSADGDDAGASGVDAGYAALGGS
jgi:long-subunit fatty acid transport protein